MYIKKKVYLQKQLFKMKYCENAIYQKQTDKQLC